MTTARKGPWPNGAQAAICFTMDNMGEAADLNRNLWPKDEPIGNHFSVKKVLPQLLALLDKYNIPATYFIESWNTNVYGDFILGELVPRGIEIAWHAWQHEAWSKLEAAEDEEANFERSFGKDGIGKWVKDGLVGSYKGFRPPGGLIHGDRTLNLCKGYGLTYLSPAAHKAAVVQFQGDDSSKTHEQLVVLPFKWATVDAYYYMETFAGLRKIKGEYSEDTQSSQTLVGRYIKEIDETIESQGFLATLFHPFLTNDPERLDAAEKIIKYLSEKQNEGLVWLTTCEQVAKYIYENPAVVGNDPEWDSSKWR